MLVLTRKTGEAITIDGDIRITILSLDGGRAKVGIEAPSHVRIDRAEVARRIAAQLSGSEMVGISE